MSQVSDGYHTFDELYEHRTTLFAALTLFLPQSWHCYRSTKHEDGGMFDGMFLVAAVGPEDQTLSYHCDLKYWDLFSHCEIQQYALPWDGHAPADVLEHLRELVSGER